MTRWILLLLGLVASTLGFAAERILDTRDGRTLSRQELATRLAEHEFILLGELHDNPHHHQARAELLALLKPQVRAVVAEHLEYGHTYTHQGDLEADLRRAGFDAQGWEWPRHRPLYEAIRALDIPLLGGNLPPARARAVVREGLPALPPVLADRLAHHPLAADAERTLDRDLAQGHCGHMPPALLPGMRLAQRARDAAMLDTLASAPGRPAVLVAGNGHVRKDYGLPSLVTDARVVSVGFVEEPVLSAQDWPQFDYLWVTPPAQRDNPCAEMRQRLSRTAK